MAGKLGSFLAKSRLGPCALQEVGRLQLVQVAKNKGIVNKLLWHATSFYGKKFRVGLDNINFTIMNLDLYPEPAGETEAAGNETLETNHRILVVDDEESMREYAVEALAYGGYQASSVNGGQTAIQALRDEHYDMV